MPDVLEKAKDTIQDAIIELRSVQAQTDSKCHKDELESLIGRLYDMELDIDMVLDP